MCEVEIIELALEWLGRDEAMTALEAHIGPDVGLVGISCWTSLHYPGAVAVARHIRQLASTLPIELRSYLTWQNDLNVKWSRRCRPEVHEFRRRFFVGERVNQE